MNITCKNELDPNFEIFCLLSLCHSPNWKEDTIKELENYEADGARFFQKHYKIVERYLKTFQKYKVSMPNEDYFFEELTDDSTLLLFTVAFEYPDYLDAAPLKLRGLLAYYISQLISHDDSCAALPDEDNMPKLADEKDILEFLDGTDASPQEKWQLLQLLRNPREWLTQFTEMINVNKDAYEKAIVSINKPLEQLLQRAKNYRDEDFLKLADTCGNAPVIYASLAIPLIQAIFSSHGYQGLLMEYLHTFKPKGNLSQETLIRQAKALSDKSKLDILCELKKSSRYNLELAEVLNLSPSTTSHHMTYLLECQFVTVEKRDGKVYYCLEKENISAFFSAFKDLLL